MRFRPSEAFRTAARYAPMAEPLGVTSRLQAGEPVSPQDAERFVAWITNATRAVLASTLPMKHGGIKRRGVMADIRTAPLAGDCSFAQAIAGYALADRGLDAKLFMAQSLEGHTVGHAMLSLKLPTTDGPRHYLIDPTYRQFCDPHHPRHKHRAMPRFVLAQQKGGTELVARLPQQGYLKMTPPTVRQYLSGYTAGRPTFKNEMAAMHFFENPPPDSGGFNAFSRVSLARIGCLIEKSQPLSQCWQIHEKTFSPTS